MTFVSYPRTRHIKGSNFQKGDHDLKAISIDEIVGKNLIIEEKMDGAQAGISFEDGKLMLQSRGHYLTGGPRERQFGLLKQWATSITTELYCALSERYVMFGENMFAKHTVFYDNLPHYFMEFDVYDKETKQFLSTDARLDLFKSAGVEKLICPVKVVSVGEFDRLTDLTDLVVESNFITENRDQNLIISAQSAGVSEESALAHTDLSREMEGLYIKWEEDGIVKGRYKFVRQTFTNSIIEQEQHWLDRPIIRNILSDEGRELMFL